MTKKPHDISRDGSASGAAPPPPFPDDDPFTAAAQETLANDAFLRERVERALRGLRRLLPPAAQAMAEEMLVEVFHEDPIVRGYVDRLRPRIAPVATDTQEKGPLGGTEPQPAAIQKARGGRGT